MTRRSSSTSSEPVTCTCPKTGRERWTGEGHAPTCAVRLSREAHEAEVTHQQGDPFGEATQTQGEIPEGCTCPPSWKARGADATDRQGHSPECALEIARVEHEAEVTHVNSLTEP